MGAWIALCRFGHAAFCALAPLTSHAPSIPESILSARRGSHGGDVGVGGGGVRAAGPSVTVICAAGGYAAGQRFRWRSKPVFHVEPGPGLPGPTTTQSSAPRILRIGATKFGRGSFAGKLLDYLSYYVGVAWQLWRMNPRPDRIVALTTPPYLSVLARGMSKLRRADHAHWVMDLYPDVMAAHGMLKESGLVYQLLAGLARWGFGGKRSAAVLTLGPDMARRCERCGAQDEDSSHSLPAVSWVPLWGTEPAGHSTHTRSANSLRRQRGWADDELVAMYSGNMGLGHRFGEILEVAGESSPNAETHPGPIRFVFYGGGKRRREIEESAREHPESRLELHDYAPAEMLTAHLQSADVHLASLNEEWTGTMVPSKLQGIFAVGRPVIFIGAAESSIGQWVRESGGGWLVRPGDVAGLRAALGEAGDPALREAKGAAARAFAEKHFDKATNVARVVEVLAKVP